MLNLFRHERLAVNWQKPPKCSFRASAWHYPAQNCIFLDQNQIFHPRKCTLRLPGIRFNRFFNKLKAFEKLKAVNESISLDDFRRILRVSASGDFEVPVSSQDFRKVRQLRYHWKEHEKTNRFMHRGALQLDSLRKKKCLILI